MAGLECVWSHGPADSHARIRLSLVWPMARRRFDVRLGDALNGFLAHGKVETWAEAEAWLRDQALAHFPDSKFAQDELREAQAH